MKIIDVPKDVSIPLTLPDGTKKERTESFKNFLVSAIDVYQGFGKGIASIRQGVKIHAAVTEDANGVVRLEDADYDALKKAVEECPFSPAFARACELGGYFAAIEKAQDVKVPIENAPARKP